MGTFKQGILGGFSGKVGTVIGFVRNGVACMRGLAMTYNDANTQAQQSQRSKFGLVGSFIRPFTSLFNFTYSNMPGTAINAAFSEIINHAIKGIYPAFEIDYPKVMVSKGTLLGAENPAVISVVPGKIDFSWDDNSADGNASFDDLAICVVYNPILKKVISEIGATRTLGTLTVTVPDAYIGSTVQTYLAFKSKAGKYSDSEYVAQVEVA